ncbi:MAG: NUDIX hydrolase [Cypionkella sp.]
MNDMQDTAQIAPDQNAAQFGAICYRMHRGKVEILLITSRDTGRWVVPKGWPIVGLGAAETAAREAWEEAGVEGSIQAMALGHFTYAKAIAGKPSVHCAVDVFALRVEALKDRFPERKERRRKWFAAAKAARKVAEPELRKLILEFAKQPPAL